ncbi:hypothetical protein [Dyella sp. 20L07]|uniref:hypothetical protein n=1 Tax=Dyella sp. 20L07 TaxID=3384240 RepID=UPI003D2CD0EB
MIGFIDAAHQMLSVLADLGTIAASGIAIYLFIAKRKKIGAALNAVLGFSFQITVSELKEKLEKLNDLNSKNEEDREKVELLFHEVIGQVRGNAFLKKHFADILKELEQMVNVKKYLTEPRKRSIVSEMREKLRHVGVTNFDQLMSSLADE